VSRPRVVVVGAGVAGLAAGWRLQQQGCDVVVLEATGEVGGKTGAIRRDGFVLNTGATVLAGSYDAMRAIAAEVGVGDQFYDPPPVIGVVRAGKVHLIRTSGLAAIGDFLRTPLLSARSKLKLAKVVRDLLRSRSKVDYERPDLRAQLDTQSVAQYCAAKLNAEICDNLLDPVLGGIYVVEGKRLSVADLWFTIWKVLLSGLLGYRSGMDFFARAVAAKLEVQTGALVTEIAREPGGTRVTWMTADGAHADHVDGVVITVPAPQVPAMFPEIDPELSRILTEGLHQANFISIRFALSRRPSTPAAVIVAGTGELGGIATISYEHHMSPDSAPSGKGLIGVLLYSDWATTRLGMSDDDIVNEVLSSLEIVEPGIAGMVEFSHVTRWSPAALNALPGTHKQIAKINRLIDPRDRVQLAGDYMVLTSVNGSIMSGEAAAKRLSNNIFGR
jgi:protoporphyrinogen/coproporphyrinogen III oxidase